MGSNPPRGDVTEGGVSWPVVIAALIGGAIGGAAGGYAGAQAGADSTDSQQEQPQPPNQ